ncbi:MAG: hypothetical protein V1837_06270 [Candidatus Woesearchaeota archaeon]
MELDEAMQILVNLGLPEAYDPKSWHWVVDEKTGWFVHKHRPGNVEMEHIRFIREKLSSEERNKLDEALFVLVHEWRDIKHDDYRRAVGAIELFFGQRGEPTFIKNDENQLIEVVMKKVIDINLPGTGIQGLLILEDGGVFSRYAIARGEIRISALKIALNRGLGGHFNVIGRSVMGLNYDHEKTTDYGKIVSKVSDAMYSTGLVVVFDTDIVLRHMLEYGGRINIMNLYPPSDDHYNLYPSTWKELDYACDNGGYDVRYDTEVMYRLPVESFKGIVLSMGKLMIPPGQLPKVEQIDRLFRLIIEDFKPCCTLISAMIQDYERLGKQIKNGPSRYEFYDHHVTEEDSIRFMFYESVSKSIHEYFLTFQYYPDWFPGVVERRRLSYEKLEEYLVANNNLRKEYNIYKLVKQFNALELELYNNRILRSGPGRIDSVLTDDITAEDDPEIVNFWLQKMVSAMLDNAKGNLKKIFPIYDINGNLLWPKRIPYEEIRHQK